MFPRELPSANTIKFTTRQWLTIAEPLPPLDQSHETYLCQHSMLDYHSLDRLSGYWLDIILLESAHEAEEQTRRATKSSGCNLGA